jgi:hypothetical protein
MLARVVKFIPCWIRGSDTLRVIRYFSDRLLPGMCDYDRIKRTGSADNDFPRLNALHAEPSSPEVETPYAG